MTEAEYIAWLKDPKVPRDLKFAVARQRALAGPNAKFWKGWYRLADDPVLIDQDGNVYRLMPES